MNKRFEHALVVGINNYQAFDGASGGPMELKHAVSDAKKTAANLAAALTPSGEIELLLDGGATRTGILGAFDKLLAKAQTKPVRRSRPFFGFAGRGGWDPLRGPFLCPSDVAPTGPDRRLFLDELEARLARELPDVGLTAWLACCFTSVGAPSRAHNRYRTLTPAAIVPSVYNRLRPVDRVIGVAPDAAWRDDAGPYDPGLPDAFGGGVEIDVGGGDFRGFDIETIGGTVIGELILTSASYAGSTNLSAGSEHWYWSATPWLDDFRLVPNGSSDHSIATPFARYAHQQFPSSDSNMVAIGTSPKAWRVGRGTSGGSASELDVVLTRSGASEDIKWYAVSTVLNGVRLLACTSSQFLELKKITANPASMSGPPSPTQVRNISTSKL